MTKTVDQILAEYKIDFGKRPRAMGNHKVLCPRCSKTRKKKADPCLSVRIGEKGIQWQDRKSVV